MLDEIAWDVASWLRADHSRRLWQCPLSATQRPVSRWWGSRQTPAQQALDLTPGSWLARNREMPSADQTFSRRTDCLTGPAKVIDGDTIIVAEQLVRLHGIDAPELDQPFWWQGQKLMGGMMALAALEVLTAGINVAVRWSSGTGTAASSQRCSPPMGSM